MAKRPDKLGSVAAQGFFAEEQAKAGYMFNYV